MIYTKRHPSHQMEPTDKAQYIIQVLNTIPLHGSPNAFGLNKKTSIWEELVSLLQLILAVENSKDTSLEKDLNTLLSHDWGMKFSSSVETMAPFYNLYLEAADYYVHTLDLQAIFFSPELSIQLNSFTIMDEEKQELSQALTLICQWQQQETTERFKKSVREFLNRNFPDKTAPTDLAKAINEHYGRAFRRLKEVIKDSSLPIADTFRVRLNDLKIKKHLETYLQKYTDKIRQTLLKKQSFFSSHPTANYVEFSKEINIQTAIFLLQQKSDIVQILDQAGVDTTENFFWVDFSQQLMELKQTCDAILFRLSQEVNEQNNERRNNIDKVILSIEALKNSTLALLLKHEPQLKRHSENLVAIDKKDHITDDDLIRSMTEIEAMSQKIAGIALLRLCKQNHENIIAKQRERHPYIIDNFTHQLRELSLAAFQKNETRDRKPDLKASADYFNQLYTYTLTLFLASRIIDLSLHESILNRWSQIAPRCLDSQDYASFDAIKQSMQYLYEKLDKNTYYRSTVTQNIETILSISLGMNDRASRNNQVVILDTRNISKGLERSKEIGGTEKLLDLLREAHNTAQNTANPIQETAWQSQIQTSDKDKTSFHNSCINRIQDKPGKMTLFTRILDADAEEITALNQIATFLNILDNAPLANTLWSHGDIDTIVQDLSTMDIARSIQGYLEDKGIDIDEETAHNIVSHYAQSRSRRSSLADLALTFQKQNPTNNTATTQRSYR